MTYSLDTVDMYVYVCLNKHTVLVNKKTENTLTLQY